MFVLKTWISVKKLRSKKIGSKNGKKRLFRHFKKEKTSNFLELSTRQFYFEFPLLILSQLLTNFVAIAPQLWSRARSLVLTSRRIKYEKFFFALPELKKKFFETKQSTLSKIGNILSGLKLEVVFLPDSLPFRLSTKTIFYNLFFFWAFSSFFAKIDFLTIFLASKKIAPKKTVAIAPKTI